MKTKTFDRKFDAGEQILDQLDLGKARRAGTDANRVMWILQHGWLAHSTGKLAG